MSKQNLNEATLMAPVFTGSDEEVATATSAWSSIISSFSYVCSSPGFGGTPMSAENKRALYCALQCYLNAKVDEVNNVTVPPVVATTPPAFVPAPEVAMSVQPSPSVDMEKSYAESQQAASAKALKESAANAFTKRMRELAGIPHPENRV